ncbi:MAG: SDR family NAD(P)-dependent oxidoreductase [Haloarculaceae archaeon]
MDLDLPDLDGKTYLLTGSTSGIGRDAARRLAQCGATVLLHGRDRERGRETLSAVREAGGDGVFVRADLADPEAVAGLARVVDERCDRLDGLVSNAALSVPERETAMGTERTLAVNHLAPYRLVHDLAPLLLESAPARVVVTTSGVHRRGEIDPETIAPGEPARSPPDEYDALAAYARSKLANLLFVYQLAARLAVVAPEVTATAYHPGFVPGTRLYRSVRGPFGLAVALAARLPGVGTSVAAGGAGLARLVASPAVAGVSGAYFAGTERALPDERVDDAALRARLWEASAELVGVDPELPLDPVAVED